MYQYHINLSLAPFEGAPSDGDCVLLLITSAELNQETTLPKLEEIRHTPSARDAHVCKAEARHGYLCGTIVTPRRTKDGKTIAFGYLITRRLFVLCDDTGTAHSMVQHLRRENPKRLYSVGDVFCEFMELMIARDLRHLESFEDQLAQMEDQVLSGCLEGFNSRMTELRREIVRWIRYYTQLYDLVCEFQENENGCFQDGELRMLHMIEKRVGRLLGEAKTMREYGMQVRELFQAEIDIRQNRIMKILTIVTTIFLPLSLVAGWYGMNFIGMPELHWKYGYPVVIGASILIVLVCVWIMKKKKFW